MTQRFARPLSLGNIMSAGITLYRSHFKSYIGMSFKAHLWMFIPVFGWAKFEVLEAAIARHGFHVLIDQPESLNTSQKTLEPKIWGFFVIQLLIWMISFGIQAVFNVGFQILSIPISIILSEPRQLPVILITSLLPLVLLLLFVMGYLWIISRLFIPELAYANERNVDIIKALERSWKLTGNQSTWEIMVIICIVSVITTPLYYLIIIPFIFALIPIFSSIFTSPSESVAIAVALFTFLLFLLIGILLILVSVGVMPLWQSLKAVIYYDVRVRKEGLGLTFASSDTSSII